MVFVSLTRLRIRSIRFLPFFLVYTLRSLQQVKRSPGFLTGALLPDRSWTFWTMTAWDTQQSMRAYMTSGAHKNAMPHLLDWCDEASVTHWEQSEPTLPRGSKPTSACASKVVLPRSITPARITLT